MKEKLILKPTVPVTIALAVAATLAIGAATLYSLPGSQPDEQSPSLTPSTSASTVRVVTALGRLEPQGEVINLSAPNSAQGARVDQLLVKEGQRVKADEVIAILDNRDRAIAALEQAKGELQVALANLAKVKAGAQAGEIDAQKATIARLEAELQGQKETLQAIVARTEAEQRNAQSDYERYQKLYKDGAVSAQELETRRLAAETTGEQVNESRASRSEKVASLQKQLDEAKATLNKITEVRPTDVQVAQAEVNRAFAAVKQAEADLALTEVKAPSTGEILKIHTQPGETISSDGIAELGRTDQMVVVAEVLESDISKVRLAQKATITSENQAFSEELQGTVTKIGRQIGKQDVLDSDPAADVDARVVEVKISVSPEDSQRVSGLTYANVVVEINI